jgi:hypothetical protein
MNNYEQLAERLRTDGGFTVKLFGAPSTSLPNARTGYAVGLKGEQYPTGADDQDIACFCRAHYDDLRLPFAHLGGWHDSETGHDWLDVVIVYQDPIKAIETARETGQLAIYDLERKQEIRL